MKIVTRVTALAAVALLALLPALPVSAGKGNSIPPGVNPFEYLIGLIDSLQAQITVLQNGGGGGGGGCHNLQSFPGSYSVINEGTGATAEVTFDADGTYDIHSGSYAAGGSLAGKTSGRWRALHGGAIAFTWEGSTGVDRIAVIQCSNGQQLSHFVMGHTHDYETLTRLRVE